MRMVMCECTKTGAEETSKANTLKPDRLQHDRPTVLFLYRPRLLNSRLAKFGVRLKNVTFQFST